MLCAILPPSCAFPDSSIAQSAPDSHIFEIGHGVLVRNPHDPVRKYPAFSDVIPRHKQTRKFHRLCHSRPHPDGIRDRQSDYYRVLGTCDKAGNSTAFVEFLLAALLTALLEVSGTDQVSDQVTDQVKSLLKVLGTKPLSAVECMTRLKLSHRPTFRANYLHPALTSGLIERTIPDKPNSRLQKYRLTEKGRAHIS